MIGRNMSQQASSSMVTIREIAEISKRSPSTVSRALRNSSLISESTRKHIQKTARELNYRPNLLMRGVRTGRSLTVGLLVPVLYDEFHIHILSAIHDELVCNDYAPLLLSTISKGRAGRPVEDRPQPTQLDQVHKLLDRRVEGVIIWPKHMKADADYLHELWKRDIPTVTVDMELPDSKTDHVGTDDYAGASQVARYLLARGHRRIGHLAGPQIDSTARLRKQGFLDALSARDDVTITCIEADRYEHIRPETLQAMLDTSPRPTAIFAANDHIARELYLAARNKGLCIPEDISLVGYGNLDYAEYLSPALSSVDQNPHLIGRKAAELLLQRINGEIEQDDPIKCFQPTELVVRESVRTL